MNRPVSFGLRIPPCRDAREVAECVAQAERVGFDVCWLPDSQFLWRDIWASLALAAVATDRIRVGPCVTTFETRHPAVTAAAAATIEELAPGRTILGIGSGDSAVKTLGLRPTTLARMREQIDVVGGLLAGEERTFDGHAMRLKAPPSGRVPMYMAANGPKALALAGELCDGAIILAGLEPGLIARAFERVAAGAARAGRGLADVDVCVGTLCHVTDDEREGARIVKPYVVAIAQVGGRHALQAIGIDIDPPAAVGGVYPDLSHAEDWPAAMDAADQWVTDDEARRYADAFCLIGPSAYVAARLRRAVDAGATSFYIRHLESYTLPERLLAAFGESIIPAFRQ